MQALEGMMSYALEELQGVMLRLWHHPMHGEALPKENQRLIDQETAFFFKVRTSYSIV